MDKYFMISEIVNSRINDCKNLTEPNLQLEEGLKRIEWEYQYVGHTKNG